MGANESGQISLTVRLNGFSVLPFVNLGANLFLFGEDGNA